MFRLTYRDDGTEHGDLFLKCGVHESRGDSYYVALDRVVDPKATTPQKVRHVLRVVFSHWLDALRQGSAEPVYLLAELFDQCSRWIEVHSDHEHVDLYLGWATREGHRLIPSRDAVHHLPPDGFVAEEEIPTYRVLRSELIRDIERCRGMLDIQDCSETDPTSILEHYRGAYGTQLLVAAVAHFDLFSHLSSGPIHLEDLRETLQLRPRPFTVLTTALRAMDLLTVSDGQVAATPHALAHLTARPFDMRDYIGLMATSPDVLAMVERLRSDRPAGSDDPEGTAFIYREGVRSAMDTSDLARHFTLSLAGRARIVAPVLARQIAIPDDIETTLLDVGGGSGIYAIAMLARHPQLRATVIDRAEVLTVAREFAIRFGVDDRLELREGDMFQCEYPDADIVLLSNILHDWDVHECQELIRRCEAALNPGGRLLIHDVFLHDDHSGPLPIALYSAALFTLTEGRAYSVAEYREWLEEAGLTVSGPFSTAVHCGVLVAE